MSILSKLFPPKHDWNWGTCPLCCRYCGVERTRANDREPCPERAK